MNPMPSPRLAQTVVCGFLLMSPIFSGPVASDVANVGCDQIRCESGGISAPARRKLIPRVTKTILAGNEEKYARRERPQGSELGARPSTPKVHIFIWPGDANVLIHS